MNSAPVEHTPYRLLDSSRFHEALNQFLRLFCFPLDVRGPPLVYRSSCFPPRFPVSFILRSAGDFLPQAFKASQKPPTSIYLPNRPERFFFYSFSTTSFLFLDRRSAESDPFSYDQPYSRARVGVVPLRLVVLLSPGWSCAPTMTLMIKRLGVLFPRVRSSFLFLPFISHPSFPLTLLSIL